MKLQALVFYFLLLIFPINKIYAGKVPTHSRFDHVIYMVFENKDYKEVIKNKYYRELFQQGVLFSRFQAETHPSQPNYIAMIAGSTLGVKGNGMVSLNNDHLGDLLEQKGLDWKVYAEDYPEKCFLGSSKGPYARKHVPFLSFKNIQYDPKRCAKIVNFKHLKYDLEKGQLANFNMVIPNNFNNSHDTDIATSSKWLERNFNSFFANPKFMERVLVIITYDEGLKSRNNEIFTVMLGGRVLSGIENQDLHNHYSLLRMIEDEFSLGTLQREDLMATPIQGIWR